MPREIRITPVLNGWIVQVGCSTVVFTALDKMAGEIIRYYRDPYGVTKEYVDSAANKVQGASAPPAPPESRMTRGTGLLQPVCAPQDCAPQDCEAAGSSY
jgi:hypothetical protein